MIKRNQKYDLSGQGFGDYAVELSLKEINCSTEEMRSLAVVNYNAVNDIIDSVDFPGKWFHIIPESI